MLSYALFPQVASKFFAARDKKPEAAPAAAAPKLDADGARVLYVDDRS